MTKFNRQTLGEICDAGGGEIKTGPFGTQLHQSDYVPDGIPVVMPKNIVAGKVSLDDIAQIGEDDADRLKQHRLNRGDIVYGRRGDIGIHALVGQRESGWLCGTGCLRITLGDGPIDPHFLHYYLNQQQVIRWIYNQAVGATMPNLNTSILRSVPIEYPPVLIQRKISGILSAYDDLIENNLRRIKILEEMAQSLYREWFVKFRFPGHEKVRMVDSPPCKIPEKWGIARLASVCKILMGQSPKSEFYNEQGDGLPFHQGVTHFGERFPTNRIYCTEMNRIAEAGDILFSVRAPVGRINIAETRLIIGRGLAAIRSRSGDQWFTFRQLKERFKDEDTMGGGTIFKAVTKQDMEGIEFLKPAADVISTFERRCDPLEKEIGNLTQKNRVLRRTRDLLLPKLISGKVDVSELGIAVPEEAEA
jgi:type I restriction enzyme S subunit